MNHALPEPRHAALRAETRQCFGTLFKGDCVCAIGLAYREFYGANSVHDIPVANGSILENLVRALDISHVPLNENANVSVDDITEMNDVECLTLPQIGDRLAEIWGIDAD